MVVLGRDDGDGPTCHLGHYRAADGSRGARVEVDLDRPHAVLVVGKRGAGKSYTLGVLAEALAATEGASPVVIDPMGAFRGLRDPPVSASVRAPAVRADALRPRDWCTVLGLDPERGPGALVWRGAAESATLSAMRRVVREADASRTVRRVADNHLALAQSLGVFGEREGPDPLDSPGAVVLDCAGTVEAATNAVVASVAATLYDGRARGDLAWLPWLLVDEAHVPFAGVAADALSRILTRGRHPGVGLVVATQRPSALPRTVHSQTDLLVAHRLTDRADRADLADARPAYMDGTFAGRLPRATGAALVVDDATERVHPVTVRERRTPHTGGTPRASGQ